MNFCSVLHTAVKLSRRGGRSLYQKIAAYFLAAIGFSSFQRRQRSPVEFLSLAPFEKNHCFSDIPGVPLETFFHSWQRNPKATGARSTKWLEREFTDPKLRGSNPTSTSRIPSYRLWQPGSIPALVPPFCGMVARNQNGLDFRHDIEFCIDPVTGYRRLQFADERQIKKAIGKLFALLRAHYLDEAEALLRKYAVHNLDNKEYAIKVIDGIRSRHEMELARSEVCLMARLSHENIIQYVTSWIEYGFVPPAQ
ncbi:hypothetical protein T265_13438, partial [Opisthorchis viverrini]